MNDPITKMRRMMGFMPACQNCRYFIAKSCGGCGHPKVTNILVKNARQPTDPDAPNIIKCGPSGKFYESRQISRDTYDPRRRSR